MSVAKKYYKVIADHYSHAGEYGQAERFAEHLKIPCRVYKLLLLFFTSFTKVCLHLSERGTFQVLHPR